MNRPAQEEPGVLPPSPPYTPIRGVSMPSPPSLPRPKSISPPQSPPPEEMTEKSLRLNIIGHKRDMKHFNRHANSHALCMSLTHLESFSL